MSCRFYPPSREGRRKHSLQYSFDSCDEIREDNESILSLLPHFAVGCKMVSKKW